MSGYSKEIDYTVSYLDQIGVVDAVHPGILIELRHKPITA